MGIDIAVSFGAPIRTVAPERSSWRVISGYGQTVAIEHGYTTVYAHADKLMVRAASGCAADKRCPCGQQRPDHRRRQHGDLRDPLQWFSIRPHSVALTR